MYLRIANRRLGDSWVDTLLNADTGLLTQSQVNQQIYDCAQQQIKASGGSMDPGTAEKICSGPINALVKVQGGTAETATKSLLPPTPDWSAISRWAAVGVFGLTALLILTRR